MEGQNLGNIRRLGERQGPWFTHLIAQSLTPSLSTGNAGAGAVCCQFNFKTLHATSQDGSYLEFLAPTVGWVCNMQYARGRGPYLFDLFIGPSVIGVVLLKS